MATPNDLISWAQSQIGTVEQPPNSNRVRYWDDIGRHDLQGKPWCCAFISAGFRAVGLSDPTFVYAPSGRRWYSDNHRLDILPKPGWVTFYNFKLPDAPNHCGIVVSSTNTTVTCIEGNTSKDSSGSQSNGGGVFLRTRPLNSCMGFGHPGFIDQQPVPQPPLPPRTIGDLGGTTYMMKQYGITIGSDGYGYVDCFEVPFDKFLTCQMNSNGDHNYPIFKSRNQEGVTRIDCKANPNTAFAINVVYAA